MHPGDLVIHVRSHGLYDDIRPIATFGLVISIRKRGYTFNVKGHATRFEDEMLVMRGVGSINWDHSSFWQVV